MPIADVQIELRDAALHEYAIDENALLQLVALAAISGLPVKKAATGWSILAAPEGSLLARAGLQPGDVVEQVAGVSIDELASPEGLRAAHTVLEATRTIRVTFLRSGSRFVYSYRVPTGAERIVDGLIDVADGGLEDAGGGGQEGGEQSDSGRRAIPPGGVRAVSETSFVVKRAWFHFLLANQAAWVGSARVVPVLRDEKAIGIKLFGIRKTSPLSELGLHNGDLLFTVAGHSVATPDDALGAYAAARNADLVKVELERKGKRMTLTYRIVP